MGKLIVYFRGREFTLTGLTQQEGEAIVRIVEILMETFPALQGTVVTWVS